LKIYKEGKPTTFRPTLLRRAMKRKLEKRATARANGKNRETLQGFATFNQRRVKGAKHKRGGTIEAAKKDFTLDEEVT